MGLLVGCQSYWADDDKMEIERPAEAAMSEIVEQEVASVESGDVTSCGKRILSASPGAAGDPCLTTAEFMNELGLTQESKQEVSELAERLENRDAATREQFAE